MLALVSCGDLAIGRASRCGAQQDASRRPAGGKGGAWPRRHAFGDQYRATDLLIKAPGKLELVFTPAGGGAPERHEVHQFDGAGVALGMCARAQRRRRARLGHAPSVSADARRQTALRHLCCACSSRGAAPIVIARRFDHLTLLLPET